MSNQRIAIIGGGYAGLAAAVTLAKQGQAVTVFEASRTLGGRARRVDKDGYVLDNGQHILLGAYTETLSLLRQLKVSPRQLWSGPFHLHLPGKLDLRAAALPAPLNLAIGLLRAKGFSWADRFAAIRLMQWLKKQRYTLHTDYSVSLLLQETQQTPKLCQYVWEPLCVAALNTPAERASAQVFAHVLRDGLAGSSSASTALIPRCDLSELFPVPAAQFLATHQGVVNIATPIKSIQHDEEGFRLTGNPQSSERFAQVILAVAPYHASALLQELSGLTRLRQQIDDLPHEPITTLYLAYPPHIRLPYPMIANDDGPLQWLFDRGQLGGPAGLIAGVVSADGPQDADGRENLTLAAHQALERQIAGLPAPLWSQLITEKRATFSCRPGLNRPLTQTPQAGLYLAGDYVAGAIDYHYPATIETAVRSGIHAAHAALRHTNSAQIA